MRAVPAALCSLIVSVCPTAIAMDRPVSIMPSAQMAAAPTGKTPAAPPTRDRGTAGRVLASWHTGNTDPFGVGMDRVRQSLWLSFYETGADGTNREFHLSGHPTGRTFDPGFATSTWAGDMTYDPVNDSIWQVRIGADHCLREWDRLTLTETGRALCGTWGTSSQRAVTYNANNDTFYVGGWNQRRIYEVARSGSVVNVCQIDLDISGMAHHAQADVLFVMVNANPNHVHVVDPDACVVESTIAIASPAFSGFSGGGLELDCQGNLLAPNQTDDRLYLVDSGLPPADLCGPLQPGIVVDSWSTPFIPWGVAFDQRNHVGWIGSFVDGSTAGPNREYLPTGQASGRIYTPTFAATTWVADMTHDPLSNTIWQVKVGVDRCLHEWNRATLAATGRTVCGPWATSQRGVAWNPAANTFYVGGWIDQSIHEVTRAGVLVRSCNIGLGISGLAYHHSANQLWAVSSAATTTLSHVDPVACSVVTTLEPPAVDLPAFASAGLDFDCDGRFLVANQSGNRVASVHSGLPKQPCGLDLIFKDGFGN